MVCIRAKWVVTILPALVKGYSVRLRPPGIGGLDLSNYISGSIENRRI